MTPAQGDIGIEGQIYFELGLFMFIANTFVGTTVTVSLIFFVFLSFCLLSTPEAFFKQILLT